MTDLFEELQEFFDTYFLTDSFNPVNSVTYVVILLIGAIFTYKLIVFFNSYAEKKWGEKFRPIYPDTGFFIAVSPYILLGSAVRAYNDAFLMPPHFLLSEPWIFGVITIYTMVLGFILILTGIKINKDYRTLLLTAGIISTAVFVIPLLFLETSGGTTGIQSWPGFFSAIILLGALVALFYAIQKKNVKFVSFSIIAFGAALTLTNVLLSEKAVKPLPDLIIDALLLVLVVIIYSIVLFLYEKQSTTESLEFMSSMNLLVISGQMWDSIATFISINYFGYTEQNLLPEFLIADLGMWFFFTAKLIIVSAAVIMLDRWWDEENQRNWIKWLIYVLGLATGTRNFLRLITLT
ncbi:MAG: DUF63 family protein [Candidatus Odinarchaeota archaeon]